MDVPVREDENSNYKVVIDTKIKTLDIVVHFATAVFAHSSFTVGIVCSWYCLLQP